MRRYEILIPIEDNDGNIFPPGIITEIVEEIANTFGGVSVDCGRIDGAWTDGDKTYTDVLRRIFVDTPGGLDVAEWFQRSKIKWEECFCQEEIYIVSYPVEKV